MQEVNFLKQFYQYIKDDQLEINIYAHNQNMKGDQVEINIYADNQSTIKR